MLTWIGIIFMVAVLVAWVWTENRRLHGHRLRLRGGSKVEIDETGAA